MKPSRLAYRAAQFWHALRTTTPPDNSPEIEAHLSPALAVLFRRLQPSEQMHALSVLHHLQAAGHSDPDLLAAALLHDCGKSLHRLNLIERVWIVLGMRLFPRRALAWGNGKPRGVGRAFVVAYQHAAWGADMVAMAGGSPRLVDLIRRHQQPADDREPLRLALYQADDSA